VGIVSGQPIPATVTFVNKGTISGFASDPGFSFYNGFGYFFGGYLATTATKVDLASGTLTKTSLPAFSATLRASCAVTTETGTMYIIGGDEDPSGQGYGSTFVRKLGLGGTSYTNLTTMSQVRQYHRCAYDQTTGRIYAISGVIVKPSFVRLSSMEYYDIFGDVWTTVASMPVLRNFFAFENGNNGQLYLLGGIDSGGNNNLEAWSYDITGDFWTPITSINNVNSRIGSTFYAPDGLILLLAGDTGVCEYYNVATNTSTTFTCNGLPSSGVSFAAINGPNVYVIQNTGGIVYEAKCVLSSACPFGCTNGVCNGAPVAPVAPMAPVAALPVPPIAVNPPVVAAPFSACSQCRAPTPFCISSLQLCVGKRVTPILQCVESVGALRRGHFSYNSGVASTFSIDSGSANNYILPTGTPSSSFTSGRQFIYPVDAFTADFAPNTIAEWFVDGFSLKFNVSDSSLNCPSAVEFAVKVASIPQDVTGFLNNLITVFSKAMGITSDRITAEVVTGRKRQSDLENEIAMTVEKSDDPEEPSPAELVSNFIQNQTAIEQVQAEIPEVQTVTGKPPPSEISGSVTENIEKSPRPPRIVQSSATKHDVANFIVVVCAIVVSSMTLFIMS
jgi:hypothetical protein